MYVVYKRADGVELRVPLGEKTPKDALKALAHRKVEGCVVDEKGVKVGSVTRRTVTKDVWEVELATDPG